MRLAVSDDHQGLKAAIARVLTCPWQRCTVHFVRSMHQYYRPSTSRWSYPIRIASTANKDRIEDDFGVSELETSLWPDDPIGS